MELTRLRHIVAVARNQSFSRAAEEEGITQPALSRSIAAFEKRHGVVLFDRGRGGTHLTPAGSLVVERATALLSAAGELERGLRLYGKGEAGRLAFGLGPLVAGLFLADIGRALLASRPGLLLVSMIRPPEQLVPELLNDRIEMILGNDWRISNVPGTMLEPLGRLELSVVVRAGHPLATAGSISAADLEHYPSASAVEMPAGAMRGNSGLFVCDNFHILRETVHATDCTWITSSNFLADDLRDGRLVQLSVGDLPTGYSEICVVSRRGRTRSPLAQVVIDRIRTLLEQSEAQAVSTVNRSRSA